VSFAVLPIEVALDPRLSKRQIKVLIALFSFMSNQSSTVWPSRDKLAERCGLRPTRISEVTTELAGLGWLSKEGKGGFSKASKYTITVPILGTVAKTRTVRTQDRRPKLVSVKSTVPKTGTRKEVSIEVSRRREGIILNQKNSSPPRSMTSKNTYLTGEARPIHKCLSIFTRPQAG